MCFSYDDSNKKRKIQVHKYAKVIYPQIQITVCLLLENTANHIFSKKLQALHNKAILFFSSLLK